MYLDIVTSDIFGYIKQGQKFTHIKVSLAGLLRKHVSLSGISFK